MASEAIVPSGVQPGQTFSVQTGNGLVHVKVPPGCRPGQMVRVPEPVPGQPPVLLGSPIPCAVASADRGPARAYRVDPLHAQADSLPLLQGVPVERAERKMGEVRKGGELARDHPFFPETRRCTDAAWIVPFVLVVGLVCAAAAVFSRDVARKYEHLTDQDSVLGGMVAAGVGGGVASLFAAGLYVALASVAPGCVVWTSLIFSPALMMVAGLALIVGGQAVLGAICAGVGALCLSCVLCCYRSIIPFTITVVKMVATVLKEKPSMVAVSMFGALAGLVWSVVCSLAFVGAYLKYQDQVQNSRSEQYAFYFLAVMIFFWGAMVTVNVCHVTYCGVFGRWYFAVDERFPIWKSLRVAMGTSFGSICLGSFLVAAIRAVEAVVSQARRNAQEDGSPLTCVLLLVLECVVSCIGDILEFFSEWAYVQCAVRGVPFLAAARITYSMMTCSNLFYVVSALLINSVVNLGALLCGIVGCAVGAGIGLGMGLHVYAISGAVAGLWAGLLCGGSAAGILSSGAKTVLVLWAETPEPLRLSRPDFHHELEDRICAGLAVS